MKKKNIIYALAAAVLATGACATAEIEVPWTPTGLSENFIRVSGVLAGRATVSSVVTKVAGEPVYTPAEDDPNMRAVLMGAGIDVSYGLLTQDSEGRDIQTQRRTANLKITSAESETPVTYSFMYRDDQGGLTTNPAEWYGNGQHFFEGSCVPSGLSSAGSSSDQSGEAYNVLGRYLTVPAGFSHAATLERVRIPFQHRLSRVIAYILIDPSMTDVTLQGYQLDSDGKDNPATTSITFGNVKVLKEVGSDNKPVWESVRKAVPHFAGVNGGLDNDGNVINGDFHLYRNKKTGEYIAPSNRQFAEAEADYTGKGENSIYELTVYPGGVPSYDLIVRPTYTSGGSVMYDEAGYFGSDGQKNITAMNALAEEQTNKIDFDLVLSNSLQYTKEFKFDLDPNFQTVVYIRIEPEAVSFNSSGSSTWVNAGEGTDGYYGVNNGNGNTLSMAGSSWQRAYRIRSGSASDTITDGSPYDQDTEEDHIAGENGQFVEQSRWIEEFLKAKEGGDRQGAYFILDESVTIDVPEDFIFAGHLDAQGNTITISRSLKGLNGTYTGDAGQYNLHKGGPGGTLLPSPGYRGEILNASFASSTCTGLFSDPASVTGYVFNCTFNGVRIPDRIPEIPGY